MAKNITKKKKLKNKNKNVWKISRGCGGRGEAACETDVGGLRFRVPHSHVVRVWLLLWLRQLLLLSSAAAADRLFAAWACLQ